MSYLCGIDPGLGGAVAVIDDKGNLISVQDTPVLQVKRGRKVKTVYCESQMATLISAIKDLGDVRAVGIEELHAMPPGRSSGSAAFSLGLGSGLWRGIVAAFRLPVVLVPPQVWKKALGLPAKAEKGESIERALRLFPMAPLTLVRHHDRGDALLIAEYVRRQNTVK